MAFAGPGLHRAGPCGPGGRLGRGLAGLGSRNGVGFNTAVNDGTATRWALSAVQPHKVVRGQYTGYRDEAGVDPQSESESESESETFITLEYFIDHWHWVGVAFSLRTGKPLAKGQRIPSFAFREPAKSMFPPG